MSDDAYDPRFSLGQMVFMSARPEISGAVTGISGPPGALTYRVFTAQQGFIDCIEDQLAPLPEPDRSGRSVGYTELSLALTAAEVLKPSRDVLHSRNAGAVDFIPYQYRPVLKVVKADRPRLLIADEVGVGKTIEAGLILKELRARDDVRTVAVVCPKPLVVERKWELEMRRFGEHFQTLDGPGLNLLASDLDTYGTIPAGMEQVIIPISALQSDELLSGRPAGPRKRGWPGLKRLSTPLAFDLVIVDEAHRARNSETITHEAVKLLCDNARAVLLLTATPLQMGQQDLYNLLRLLRPDLIDSAFAFNQMAAPNPHINTAAELVRGGGAGWSEKAAAALDLALKTHWGTRVLAQDQSMQEALAGLRSGRDDDETRVALTRQIENLHTFSHLINRTRRRDIGDFTIRRAETLKVDFTDEQRNFHDAVVAFVESVHRRRGTRSNMNFLLSGIRQQAASCTPGLAMRLQDMAAVQRIDSDSDDVPDSGEWPTGVYWDMSEFSAEIRSLASRGAPLVDGPDPKIDKLLAAIRTAEGTEGKVLIFATFRHTIAYLERRLAEAGVRVGVITGAVPDQNRVWLRNRFSKPRAASDALDVLLCSEVGSEGLDFQFCSTLANYDLPWNPMRIEQRIGRIDRYGQKAEFVSIWNLITRDTLDDDIYTRCLDRIGIFKRAIGATEDIFGRLADGLAAISWTPGLTPAERAARLQQLTDNAYRDSQELANLAEEETGLFGLRVGKSAEEEVDAAFSAWLGGPALVMLLNDYLLRMGHPGPVPFDGPTGRIDIKSEVLARLIKDAEAHSPNGPADRWVQVLRRNGKSLRLTVDAAAAEVDRDLELLHAAHPLIRAASASSVVGRDLRVALSTSAANLPPGRYPFGVWRWRRLGLREEHETVWLSLHSEAGPLAASVAAAADAPQVQEVTSAERQDLADAHRRRWEDGRLDFKTAVAATVDARLRAAQAQSAAEIQRLEVVLQTLNDERVRRMRVGEIRAVRQRLELREAELGSLRERADILTDPLVLGVLEVRR